MAPRTIQITFDAADPIALSRFWADVLGYVIPPPPGVTLAAGDDPIDTWMAFLADHGVPEAERRTSSALEHPTGAGPRIYFQKVPEPKGTKNRLHVDVRAGTGLQGDERMAALEAEAERLVALGATRLDRFEPDPLKGAGHVVMADPEGNEFCLD